MTKIISRKQNSDIATKRGILKNSIIDSSSNNFIIEYDIDASAYNDNVIIFGISISSYIRMFDFLIYPIYLYYDNNVPVNRPYLNIVKPLEYHDSTYNWTGYAELDLNFRKIRLVTTSSNADISTYHLYIDENISF